MQKYEKVPIYPLAKYLSPAEHEGIPAPLKPVAFEFDGAMVTVDDVVVCERGVSLKVGGRGFLFNCRVSWTPGGVTRTKQSVLWYDDFYDEWFVEVPAGRKPGSRESSLMPVVSMPGKPPNSSSAAILFTEKHVREPIYPLVRYLRPEEKKSIPSNKIPYAFTYGEDTIEVMCMRECSLALARKTKEKNDGCRFVCLAENQRESPRRKLQSILWFDIENSAWFYEVSESCVVRDWEDCSQVM